MKLKPPQQELIDRVRRDLGSHGASISDEEILEHWQGSLELASLQISWSWLELKREVKKSIPGWCFSVWFKLALSLPLFFMLVYDNLRFGWSL